jgi:hypothetical protein
MNATDDATLGMTTTVRLPLALVEQIREMAVSHDRSLSAELRVALAYYIQTAAEQPLNGEIKLDVEDGGSVTTVRFFGREIARDGGRDGLAVYRTGNGRLIAYHGDAGKQWEVATIETLRERLSPRAYADLCRELGAPVR